MSMTLTAQLMWASISIIAAFNSAAVKKAEIVLDDIEIGNEPDLYAGNGLRGSDWSVSQYYTQCVISLI